MASWCDWRLWSWAWCGTEEASCICLGVCFTECRCANTSSLQWVPGIRFDVNLGWVLDDSLSCSQPALFLLASGPRG
ncbi:UHRF1-binding protein 1, partial [Clarias magur]